MMSEISVDHLAYTHTHTHKSMKQNTRNKRLESLNIPLSPKETPKQTPQSLECFNIWAIIASLLGRVFSTFIS